MFKNLANSHLSFFTFVETEMRHDETMEMFFNRKQEWFLKNKKPTYRLFISGSMSIETIPELVKATLRSAKSKGYYFLVGDCSGVDALVQDELADANTTVYTICDQPRHNRHNLKTMKIDSSGMSGRSAQTQKDICMTKNSDASLVIWDGKSQDSLDNIRRALEFRKRIEVFTDRFLSQDEIIKL